MCVRLLCSVIWSYLYKTHCFWCLMISVWHGPRVITLMQLPHCFDHAIYAHARWMSCFCFTLHVFRCQFCYRTYIYICVCSPILFTIRFDSIVIYVYIYICFSCTLLLWFRSYDYIYIYLYMYMLAYTLHCSDSDLLFIHIYICTCICWPMFFIILILVTWDIYTHSCIPLSLYISLYVYFPCTSLLWFLILWLYIHISIYVYACLFTLPYICVYIYMYYVCLLPWPRFHMWICGSFLSHGSLNLLDAYGHDGPCFCFCLLIVMNPT